MTICNTWFFSSTPPLPAQPNPTGVHIKDWPIYGMYQPDGIAWFRWNGEDYVVTANEGNFVRVHGSEGLVFDETVRGYNISGIYSCFGF